MKNPTSTPSRTKDAITTIGSISAILVLVLYQLNSASTNHRLERLETGIIQAETNLSQRISLLKKQVKSDSLIQELAFERFRDQAAQNEAPDAKEAIPEKTKSSPTEAPVRKIKPELTTSEKPIFKEIMALIKTDDKEAALDLLYDSIDEASSAAFYFIAGSLLAQNGETGKALDFFLTALDKFPNFYRAARNAGIMQMQIQDLQGSKRNLLKAQSLGPEPNSTTNGLLALSYLNSGDPISAEHNYRSAIELQPDIKDWWLGLARSLMEQGKKAEGQETIQYIEKTWGAIPVETSEG